MNLKNKIVRGKHVKELLKEMDISALHMQSILGLFAPSITKLFSSEMLERAVDRKLVGPIRFINANWPDFFTCMPTASLLGTTTLEQLRDANRKHPIVINDTPLDLDTISHLSLASFRQYGAARKIHTGEAKPPLQMIQWMNILRFCVETGRQDLITKTILEEANAHRLSIPLLLSKSWPGMAAKG